MSKSQTCELNFSVKGMHCAACELTLEESLNKIKGVKSAKVSLNSKQAQVEVMEGVSSQEVLQKVNQELKEKGYSLQSSQNSTTKTQTNWEELTYALAISLVLILVFIGLQMAGFGKLINGQMNFGLAFLIGIIASVSSCMALTGGILLSLSSFSVKNTNSNNNPKIPQISFHIARLVSFAVFGGLIGLLGSILTFNLTLELTLKIFMVFLMLILGINLLEVFPFFKNLEPKMPKFVSKFAYKQSQKSLETKASQNSFQNLFFANLVPILIGILTFFFALRIYSIYANLYTFHQKFLGRINAYDGFCTRNFARFVFD